MFFLHQLNFETVKEGEQYIPFLLIGMALCFKTVALRP